MSPTSRSGDVFALYCEAFRALYPNTQPGDYELSPSVLDEFAARLLERSGRATVACPTCDGDGTLTTVPGQYGPCHTCGGAGKLLKFVASEKLAQQDTERLNWLERMVVEVRVPLRWGSRQLFISNPAEVEGMDDDPSNIRAQIDYQRNGGTKP